MGKLSSHDFFHCLKVHSLFVAISLYLVRF